VDWDAERLGDIDDLLRHLYVGTRRRGIAARMIVHQDTALSILLHRLYFSVSAQK
jgi:hypothetical protein